MNTPVNATICCLSLKKKVNLYQCKREEMELLTRSGRYRHQTKSLNYSLKNRSNRKSSSSSKKNIVNQAGPIRKYKKKSPQTEKSYSPNVLVDTSSRAKQYKEVKLSVTPHRQEMGKLNKSLKSKSGRKPLACKKNIMNETRSMSKGKSILLETLNETLEAGSVRRSKRKSSILKETLVVESVNRSKVKSFVQKKNLNETSKVPFTSTPIKQCRVFVQRCEDENLNTHNSRSKKKTLKEQKNSNKTPVLESLRDSTSYILRPRRQTPCISETYTLKSTKGLKRPSKRSKSVTKTKMNLKSFAGTSTIDDLALSVIKAHKRKAKSEGYKIPSKNTLKRKRFVFNELNKADDDYEDDIYESQKFDFFKNIRIDSDSDLSMLSIATPKLGVHVTPMIHKNTPVFRDCISPTEYAINRKVAEECQFRFKRRKKASSASEKTPVPEKKKLEFSRVLQGIELKEKTFQRIIEGETSELENSYFSDCSRLSEKRHQ